ncbi:MAG: o-succinylbenzoate synthase [Chlorobiales bacterium]|nr:o-succinylbenzoate synthase [Chlorobiales bacterium]
MNATHILLYRYAIPFTEPISVIGRRVQQREGIILALKTTEGHHTAYGEVAPLPGLHQETLEAAEEQLVEVISKHEFTDNSILPEDLFPSVRTGLEMAMINLDALTSGDAPVFSDGAIRAAKNVPVNALLFGETKQVIRRAEEYFNLGYRTFKLKVSSGDMDTAIRSIEALNRIYGNTVELRLDANQSFSLDEALSFTEHLPQESIAYIEEPLKQAEYIEEFYAKTAIRSALDETLWQNPELLDQIPPEALSALILKPNRLGGIWATLQLVRYAKKHNLLAVFSSAFESGISLSFYSWLAASTTSKPAACGLDTYRYLKHDLLETPFMAANGLLDAYKLYKAGLTVNLRHLKPTSLWTL